MTETTDGRDAREAERANRTFWDADADAYQAQHAEQFEREACAWGVWGIPESQLGVLGPTRDLDVLELGCGSAQWAVGLALAGARVVGLDLSVGQLRHARARVERARVRVPLVLASATATPFTSESFDLVFCDHGAMSFCDPAHTVPEVARLLRPGGRLVFNCTTRLLYWTYDAERDRQGRKLVAGAFDRRRWCFEEGTIDFAVSDGEWLRRFAANGLVALDLVELRAPKGATTTFTEFAPYELARDWPLEQIWVVEKPAATASR
ncbi:MAG TPA: class I SAM-dependent methyltransferase [Acidimicrobiia bacterium]|nr:class I SAM-dependent methyltransferase [Acidimicrobiia bacterium]